MSGWRSKGKYETNIKEKHIRNRQHKFVSSTLCWVYVSRYSPFIQIAARIEMQMPIFNLARHVVPVHIYISCIGSYLKECTLKIGGILSYNVPILVQ